MFFPTVQKLIAFIVSMGVRQAMLIDFRADRHGRDWTTAFLNRVMLGIFRTNT
jgi:hypothetical protein